MSAMTGIHRAFSGPAGERYIVAHVVRVSNDPHDRTAGTREIRSRPHTGPLGVLALDIRDDRAAAALRTAAAANRSERAAGRLARELTTIEVPSGQPVHSGLDGESLAKVRLPAHAVGLQPAARNARWRPDLRHLRLACGRAGSRT